LSPIRPEAARRRRLLTRGFPIAAVAAAAFVAGVVAGSNGPDLSAVRRFVHDWERQDLASMYREISPEAAKRYPLEEFTDAYAEAQKAATVTAVSANDPDAGEVDQRDVALVDVSFRTNVFGELSGRLALPLDGDRIAWSPNLVFPGLDRGERLVRRTDVPERAAILARDGTPLAEGPATGRASPLGDAAGSVAGEISAPDPRQDRRLSLRGFPPGTPTGASGLELAFNRRLAGRPGGQLVAIPSRSGQAAGGGPVLASSEPAPGTPVHTTIDPDLQQAAVAALGGQYGGVAVLDAGNGSVLALAGIAFSGPQPPGSTFKVITTTAALEAGVVQLSDEFPVQTSTVVGGREVANAHKEACGGSFVEAFAASCNSVFVPLGPKVGSDGLVHTAELYGFNSPPGLFDDSALRALSVPESTIPTSIPDEVELGVSAIGQGRVLATPLEMASVAQTVANGGVRSPTRMVTDRALGGGEDAVRVTSRKVAGTLAMLMTRVVTDGTGTAAALPGIQVAGKTGTAELGPQALEPGQQQPLGTAVEQNVDAWFTGFAPVDDPKLAAAAMIVNADGDGGTVAAPIVREVLSAGLGAG
jgi:transpeptidase family protein/MecA-like transpeptidase family protein